MALLLIHLISLECSPQPTNVFASVIRQAKAGHFWFELHNYAPFSMLVYIVQSLSLAICLFAPEQDVLATTGLQLCFRVIYF